VTQPRDTVVFNGVQNFLNEVRESPLVNQDPVATWLEETESLMQFIIIETTDRIPENILEDIDRLESLTRTLRTNRGDSQSYSKVAGWAKDEVESVLSALSKWNAGLLAVTDGNSQSVSQDIAQARESIEAAIIILSDVIQETESRLDRGELNGDTVEEYELAVLRDVAVPTLTDLVARLDALGRSELGAWGSFLQRLAGMARHPLAVEALSQAALQLRKALSGT